MLKVLRLTLFLVCVVVVSNACLNVDGTTLDGHTAPEGERPDYELEEVESLTPAQKLQAYQQLRVPGADPASQPEFEAVKNLMCGQITTGIEALLTIEKATPGRYSTATNLGTGYELDGNNSEALRWITEGIKRNPQSHEGTEWLHQYILETKISLASNPKLFEKNRLINLPETFDLVTNIQVAQKTYTIAQVKDALHHQLHERMLFVKPKDPVVSEMLFAYSWIIAHTATVEPALGLLYKSRDYGFADVALWNKTSEIYTSARERHYEVKQRWQSFWIFGAAATIIGFLVLAYMLQKKKPNNKPRT